MSAPTSQQAVGPMLRDWRERRRLSQLDLAIQADISTRHLSFVETGRSKPTPQMILRLTEHLDVPLRERNELLLAGGYAPAYPHHGLDEPELLRVRAALRQVLDSHQPMPAVVLDRWWNLLDSNAGIAPLIDGCAAHLLEPPVNVLRLSLHPDGMAPRIANLGQWRSHLLTQLDHRLRATGDRILRELQLELLEYPGDEPRALTPGAVLVPLRLRDSGNGHELAFFSLTSRVETAADITVDELRVESFYPADEQTFAALNISRGTAAAR